MKKIDIKDVSRTEGMRLIWKHTHKDYKGEMSGRKSLMVAGGSIEFLDNMPEKAWDDSLKHAVRLENSENARAIGVSLFKKHGVWPMDHGLVNQCFGTFPGMLRAIQMLDFTPEDEIAENISNLITDINAAEREFDPTAEVRDAMIAFLQKEHGLTGLDKHDLCFMNTQTNIDGLNKIIEKVLEHPAQEKAQAKLNRLVNALERKVSKSIESPALD